MERKKEKKTDLRDAISVVMAKMATPVLHLLGKQGTALPGKIALSISPSLLQDLSAGIGEKIIAVCGTNGKTTVNNLIWSILKTEGYSVVCNQLGANMTNGIVSAFVQAADHFGTLKADFACLEIDEAAAPAVFPLIKPDILVLTNLFRDQLDRYGEIDMIMDKLAQAIRAVPEMKLVINADDPLSCYLAKKSGNTFVTYGISEKVRGNAENAREEIREGRFCKNCGELLVYDHYHYSQMGVWRCPGCSFSRPVPDYEASGIRFHEGIQFRIGPQPVQTSMTGLYSVYNILAAFGALSEAGQGEYLREHLQTALTAYHPQFGRGEQFTIGGKKVILSLAKNPAGFNQNIYTVLEDEEKKDLVVAINDNDQDGRDISWLWDVDFHLLQGHGIRSVTVSGIRALDLALRFKYSEIRTEIKESIREAIESELNGNDSSIRLYVLVNYTALFETHKFLKEMEESV